MTWLPVETSTAPTREPVKLAALRAFLRIDTEDHDQTLFALLAAARGHVERFTGVRLFTQTVKMRCDAFRDEMRLPCAPLQEITSVKYLDETLTQQTLSPTVYDASLFGLTPRLYLISGKAWPTVGCSAKAIEITATAGFGTIDDLPPDMRVALFLMVGHLFDTDGTAADLPEAAKMLLGPFGGGSFA